MSFTNKTPNYELPQWLADDKPTFLSDMNGAFSDIDTAMKANENAAASAQSTADANTLSINGITTDIDGAGGVKARLTAVETAESNLEGSVNTINSLIGNGTPTTTDQTIIGAINEIVAFTGEGPLDTTAQTVTGAINELAAGGNVGALDDLSDVAITDPQSGDALVFNGTEWVNQAGGAGGGNLSYLGLHNITVTADGVKTHKELLQEAYAALKTYVNAKGSEYRFQLLTMSPDISIYSGSCLKHNMYTNSFNDSIECFATYYGEHGFATAANAGYATFDWSTGTETDVSATVPTSGKTCRIQIDEYEVA